MPKTIWERILITILVLPMAFTVSTYILYPGQIFSYSQNNALETSEAFNSCPIIKSSNQIYASDISQIITQTNQDRQNAGLPSLCFNQKLENAANAKAEDMVKQDYFSHTNPQGQSLEHWLFKANYYYEKVGENLAVNFMDPNSVELAWMNSPHHQENILNPSFSEIGVAVEPGIYNGTQTLFFVAYYGQPD